jgi:hypothetical protein
MRARKGSRGTKLQMKILGFRLTVGFIGLVWVVSVLAFPRWLSPAPLPGPCDVAGLPVQVRAALKSGFDGWRPRQLADLDADDQKLWLDGSNKQGCPGIAVGHFESAKELSYALLLVPESRSAHGYKVVVLSRQGNGGYLPTSLDQGSEDVSRLVVLKAEPGKFSDFEETKSIHTKLDSVVLEWMEAAAVLYYWYAGRYERIQISD